MKIFISWSGERSRLVAELFSSWIQSVIQAVRPWISTKDIDRGAIWFSEINEQLSNISVGIICLTQENKDKPWILFETGALAKGLSSSRVCPLLIDVESVDLRPPLSLFNHTLPNKSGVWELVRTINTSLKENALHDVILINSFETYWSQFESKFQTILSTTDVPQNVPPRSEDDKMNEVLESVRLLSKEVRQLKRGSSVPSESVFQGIAPPNLKPKYEIIARLSNASMTNLEISDYIMRTFDVPGVSHSLSSDLILTLVLHVAPGDSVIKRILDWLRWQKGIQILSHSPVWQNETAST